MAITKQNDQLGVTSDYGFSTGWDWKGEYVGRLKEDGYERFSQYSASPDSTLMFAGPARYTGLSDNTANLIPIGLTDGIQFQANAQLARLYEIGSNRSFFTRGKTVSALSFGRMLADQANILKALTQNSYQPLMATEGLSNAASEANTNMIMNLDSETMAVPFGLLLVFKTRGGGGDGYGKTLSAVYLEYAMIEGYNFSVNSQAPVIVEGVSIQYDRPVPVSIV